MINPFSVEIDGLVNIANGKKSHSTDLPNAKQIGLSALEKTGKSGSDAKVLTLVERS